QVDFSARASVHRDQSDSHPSAAAADPPDGAAGEIERGRRSGHIGLHGGASAPSPAGTGGRPSAAQGHRRIGFLGTSSDAGQPAPASGSAGAGTLAPSTAARNKQTRKQYRYIALH